MLTYTYISKGKFGLVGEQKDFGTIRMDVSSAERFIEADNGRVRIETIKSDT